MADRLAAEQNMVPMFLWCKCCSDTQWQTHRRLSTANPPVTQQVWNHGGSTAPSELYTVSAIVVDPATGDTLVGSPYWDMYWENLASPLLVARYSGVDGHLIWKTTVVPTTPGSGFWLESLALSPDASKVAFSAVAAGAGVGVLSASTGNVLWKAAVPATADPIEGQTGSVVSWIGPNVILRGHNLQVQSFVGSTGAVNWSSVAGGFLEFYSIAYAGGQLYGWGNTVSASGSIFGFWQINPDTGVATLVTATPSSTLSLMMAAFSDGTVLSQGGGALWRHHPNAALTTVWRTSVPYCWQVALDGAGNVYGATQGTTIPGMTPGGLIRVSAAGHYDYAWSSPDVNGGDGAYKAISVAVNAATSAPYIGGSPMRWTKPG